MHMQIEWVKKVPKIRDETKLNPTLEHVMDLIENQLKIMNDPQYGHISRLAFLHAKTLVRHS